MKKTSADNRIKKPESFVPAFGRDWLLPLYDPALRWIMREEVFKRHLIHDAHIQSGQRVLDLGCGTATLILLIKELHPGAEVVGLDADERVLKVGQRKAHQAAVQPVLHQGFSYELPYRDDSFDRVLSSLFFHHLSRQHKQHTLQEVRRVLRPGGSLHVVDFGPPATRVGRWLAHRMMRGEELRDNLEGRLVPMLIEAGFHQAKEDGDRHGTIVGTLWFWRGQKP